MYEIGKVKVDELVREYGTPLFVYDEEKINAVIKDYKDNFVSRKFDTRIIYASKAFECLHMYSLVEQNKIGVDVVTGGELYGAIKAKVNMDNVFFHGNNKTIDEIELAINNRVKNIVIDNLDEVDEWLEATENINYKINVLLRINIGVAAHTHEYIITSKPNSKFGFYIENADIKEAIDKLKASKNLVFMGFHSHIGSQVFEMSGYLISIEKLLDLRERLNVDIKWLNLGGGFGIKYTDEDHPLATSFVCQQLIQKVEEELEKRNVHIEELMIEPGRSIVGEAGYTLYTINNMKMAMDKTYYFIDGGMSDNIRPALYQAKYSCDIANRMDEAKVRQVSIAGKCCETGDVLFEDVMLPCAKRGDILVVYDTGAYGYSMASNYNKLPRPAIVFVNKGKSKIAVARETYEKVYQNDFL